MKYIGQEEGMKRIKALGGGICRADSVIALHAGYEAAESFEEFVRDVLAHHDMCLTYARACEAVANGELPSVKLQ